jgi:selenophosphate synthetase-related protein
MPLFSQSVRGLVIISADQSDVSQIFDIAKSSGIEAKEIGRVTGNRLVIRDVIDYPVEELFEIYMNAIPALMEAADVLA